MHRLFALAVATLASATVLVKPVLADTLPVRPSSVVVSVTVDPYATATISKSSFQLTATVDLIANNLKRKIYDTAQITVDTNTACKLICPTSVKLIPQDTGRHDEYQYSVVLDFLLPTGGIPNVTKSYQGKDQILAFSRNGIYGSGGNIQLEASIDLTWNVLLDKAGVYTTPMEKPVTLTLMAM